MNRKETTRFLSELLENERLNKFGVHYAKEVTLDYGCKKPRRVDYMMFKPVNSYSIQGIEHGYFTCYEVKSCIEDVYSGNGLNFVGDKNYIVTTMETYKKIQKDMRSGKLDEHVLECNEGKLTSYGVMVAIPYNPYQTLQQNMIDEYENPTPLSKDERWQLCIPYPCHDYSYRRRSTVELLFCMLRSGR